VKLRIVEKYIQRCQVEQTIQIARSHTIRSEESIHNLLGNSIPHKLILFKSITPVSQGSVYLALFVSTLQLAGRHLVSQSYFRNSRGHKTLPRTRNKDNSYLTKNLIEKSFFSLLPLIFLNSTYPI
jgi:hypothetical protein